MTEENKKSAAAHIANELSQILERYSEAWEPTKTIIGNGKRFIKEKYSEDKSKINTFLGYQIGYLKKFLMKQTLITPEQELKFKIRKKKSEKINDQVSSEELQPSKSKEKDQSLPPLLNSYYVVTRIIKGEQPTSSLLLNVKQTREVMDLIEELTTLQRDNAWNVLEKSKELTSSTQEHLPKIRRQKTPPTPITENLIEKADEENSSNRLR